MPWRWTKYKVWKGYFISPTRLVTAVVSWLFHNPDERSAKPVISKLFEGQSILMKIIYWTIKKSQRMPWFVYIFRINRSGQFWLEVCRQYFTLTFSLLKCIWVHLIRVIDLICVIVDQKCEATFCMQSLELLTRKFLIFIKNFNWL